jgi:hypothetical protein
VAGFQLTPPSYIFGLGLIYNHIPGQIYDYESRARANTGAGEFTNSDLGVMKLYGLG